jgi:RNA polymerase sigma-70 factor (ECF subfamily)
VVQKDARDVLADCLDGGDETAWEEFVRRFRPVLARGVRLGLARAGQRIEAALEDDLMQEVYCRLLDRGRRALALCRGRSEGEVAAYLRRVAENVTYDSLRAVSASKRGQDRLVSLSRRDAEASLARLSDPRGCPERRLLRRELRRRFSGHVGQLLQGKVEARNRRVLELAVLHGWSSRELATWLGEGKKPGSIDSLLHRLRLRLRAGGLSLPARR